MRFMPWHNRILRAGCAIVLCLGLLAALFYQRGSIEQAEKKLSQDLISSAWKTSELVFEGQRLGMAMQQFRASNLSFEEVQTRFDIFWSRVSVVQQLDMDGRPRLKANFQALREFLEETDALVFAEVPPSGSVVDDLIRRLETLIVQTRIIWVNEYNQNDIMEITPAAVEIAKQRSLWKTGSAVLLAVVLFYLLVELYFSSIAQRREKQLTHAAQMASQAKSAFIANVSHEIRTPLNGILGMSRLLAESELDEDQKNCLGVLEEAGEVLLSTINDVLDYSKIEAGELAVENTSFDVVVMVEKVRALYEPAAKGKGLELKVVAERAELPILRGDSRRLRQILHNLVSNALKFTTKGSITIRYDYVEKDDAERLAGLHIFVSDTGIGIAPTALSAIFEPFGQADVSTSRSYGGTGLGLTISRDLSRAMGGDLQVTSEVARGSEFHLFVPLSPALGSSEPLEHQQARVAKDEDFSTLHVVVVDDNATNRLILRRFLAPMGVVPVEFGSGQQVVDYMASHDADLILMDVQMPGMDGVEATAQILRKLEHQSRAAPRIVAVTANVLSHQIDTYKSGGMTEVLSKPVFKPELSKIVAVAAEAAQSDKISERISSTEVA